MAVFISMIIGILIGIFIALSIGIICMDNEEIFQNLFSESFMKNDKIEIKRSNTSFNINCKDKELFKDFIKEHNLNNIKIGDSTFYFDDNRTIQIN